MQVDDERLEELCVIAIKEIDEAAAVQMGKHFQGIEISEKYFDIACRRIGEALRAPDMFIEKPQPIKQAELL